MLQLLSGLIRRVRQHHAIEHATLHVLGARFPDRRFAGLSDPVGFTIYGDIDEYSVRRAVGDALLRLQAGEHGLAIHPNCGSMLATTGVLTTLVALAAGGGKRPWWERFNSALLFVLLVLTVSKPIGLRLQAYTVQAEVNDRWLVSITPIDIAGINAHRVAFE